MSRSGASVADLRRVIGFDRWCWPLADPETLLPSSGIAEHDFGPGVPRMLELEYSVDDFAAKHVVARRVNSAAGLSVETGADLSRSARWDEVMRIRARRCRQAACRMHSDVGAGPSLSVTAHPPFEEDGSGSPWRSGRALPGAAPQRHEHDRGSDHRVGSAGHDRARPPPATRELDSRSSQVDRCFALCQPLRPLVDAAIGGVSGGDVGAIGQRAHTGARAGSRRGREVGDDRGRLP